MNTEPELIDHIAKAHRTATEAQSTESPFGFGTRVVAKWQELRRNEIFQAWERFSIRTAIGATCCAVFIGIIAIAKETLQSEELIVPPPEAVAPIID